MRFLVVPSMMVLVCVAGGCTGSGSASPQPDAGRVTGPLSMDAYWEGLASSLGVSDPPPVEIVREVEPGRDADSAWTSCLQDRGWAVEPQPGGGWVVELGEGAEERYARDSYACRASYPVAERFRVEWGEEQTRVFYEHLVDNFVPCVRDQGYVISSPPSLESYVAGDMLGWVPSSEVLPQVLDDVPDRWADVDEFYSVCPHDPPMAELYPEQ